MRYPVHGPVGLLFGGKVVIGSDCVLGTGDLLGPRRMAGSCLVDEEGPKHRCQIEPMVGPVELLLGVRFDELRKKGPVKRRVLADEDRFFALNPQVLKKIDDLLGHAMRRRSVF